MTTTGDTMHDYFGLAVVITRISQISDGASIEQPGRLLDEYSIY